MVACAGHYPVAVDVMLVTPDEVTAEALTRQLQEFEHDVTWGTDAAASIRAFRDRLFDGLLVDNRLGDRSGVDLLIEVRSVDQSVPVVIFDRTASRMVDDAALEAGAVGFIALDTVTGELLDRTLRYARTIQVVRTRQSTRGRVGGKELTLQVAIARGMTVKDAAWAAGMSERTAYRRLKSPEFQAQLAALQHELRTRIVERTVHDLST